MNTSAPAFNDNEYFLNGPPTDGISSVTFGPSSNNLLASSWDSCVYLYDAGANVRLASFPCKAAVLDCCFWDPQHGFCGGLDRSLKMFDFNNGSESVLGSHNGAIRCVEFSLHSGLVFTGGWDGQMLAWDPRSPSPCVQSLPQPGKVFTMALSDNRVVVGTSGRQVVTYDMRRLTAGPETQRESSLKYQTRVIRCFNDRTGYALGSIEGRVAVEFFDPSPEAQAKKYAFKCHRTADTIFPVNAMAFHPIFGTFATGGCDGIVNVWDGQNKKRLSQFPKYQTGISSLAFNHDGSLLAIAVSYTFEQGEIEHPEDTIVIRLVSDSDVRQKPVNVRK
eukprot:CAMPEP_0113944414 /NCGR_PEP_ID=MMETSP1339-20121228/34406_1 /TAXON_ID=94617 /ORGANISM="Fibrocapsa japonica" /LENGTH=333 /DNA_ID=CAMNT_0000949619 /DNA_START=85 /DNA_END=1086 /DNA_ORIENTATION=+ /assembly_acc=CAM_ASM_000762